MLLLFILKKLVLVKSVPFLKGSNMELMRAQPKRPTPKDFRLWGRL